MSTSIIRKYTVLFTFLFPITSIGFDQPDSLPASLTAIIDGRTAGLSDEEILIHNEWTSAKLLGEFFCQEIGLRELGKKLKGADRIFIDGIEQAPKFIAKNRIAGFGSVRFQEGWKDFTYECAIDMETGDALEFIYTEAS